GNYTLTGGAGSDTFDVSGFVGFDVIITDFNGLPGGDVIGRHGMLTNFAPGVSNIADYLQTVTVDGSTTIRADVDGPGPGFTFVGWCLVQGVSTDVAGLVANGSILGVGNTAVPAIQGTISADNIGSTTSSDLILGLDGNDSLSGLAGADTLDGGTGADTMAGG